MKKKNESLKNTFSNIKRCWKYIRKQKSKLFLCLLFSLFLCIISVITPLLSAKLLLNLTDNLLDKLIHIAILVFIIESCRNVCRFFYAKFINRFLLDTILDVQYELASETMKLEVTELDKKSSGVFIDRLNNDTREIVNIFTNIGDAIIDVVANIGVLFAVFYINPIMAFYFVVTCTILFIFEKIRMKKFFEIDKKRRKMAEKNTGLASELIRGIRDIKVLNAHNQFLEKTNDKLKETNEERYKMQKVSFSYNLLSSEIRDIFNLALIILGVTLVKTNNLNVEDFVIIYMYKDRILGLLTYFTRVLELLKNFNLAADRVFEIIDDDCFKKEKFGNKSIEKANGDFEFRNVTFGYDESRIILDNLSFKIKANETVSFVGKSGAGKSTIFSLIDKLYNIQGGEILIDNININELTQDSIRNNMSIITQNPYIFNFSIKENLKLVKEDLTEDEMIDVCKTACLHDYIMTLPEKYDTIVGEGGITLSGGQKQRLAIARALLKKTEIILFDEATSALDNETQHEIQQAINNMKGEYTILIIAHRLSTVINSDRIILIDDGQLVAEGTHKELIEKNEYYRHLYEQELV